MITAMLRPLDYAALAFALAVTGLSAVFVYGGGGGKGEFVIRGEGETYFYPVDAKETILVPGPLGETVIRLENGTGRVISSPCANQTCVAVGRIHAPGEWAACLPNRVMLSVEARSSQRDRADGQPLPPDAAAW